MNPFIERTEDPLYTTWADINWHNVEENVRRLQARIYRATTNKAWRTAENSRSGLFEPRPTNSWLSVL